MFSTLSTTNDGSLTRIFERTKANIFVAFREEITGISSCPYSASSPHSLIPCLLTDQNFGNVFEKGHQRNVFMKLFHCLTSGFREEDFLGKKMFMAYSESSPHSPEPYLMTDRNWPKNL